MELLYIGGFIALLIIVRRYIGDKFKGKFNK